jgi:hypothetical protein
MNTLHYRLLPAVFALSLIVSCTGVKNSDESTDPVKAIIPVKCASVQEKPITVYQSLNGVTQFQKKDNIRSNSTGYIESLNYRVGDNIQKGNLFCTIKTKEQTALSSTQSKDSTLSRFSKPLSVFSNSTGTLASVSYVQGDYIAEGDILATVLEPNSLIVLVYVPFEYRTSIQNGRNCEIILPDGKIIDRPISGEMPTVDAVSQSQAFFIRVNDISLPENLNVTVRFPTNFVAKTLTVPLDAIQTDEQQREFWVMKVVNDTLAIKVPISLGLRNDSIAEILSEKIHLKDLVVTKGSYQLEDSSTIKIQRGE